MPDGIRRFGVLVHQDAPFPTLGQRWRHIEELGFDQISSPTTWGTTAIWAGPGSTAGRSWRPWPLRPAGSRADGWNTHGPFGGTVNEIVDLTRRQNDKLDELCSAAGRHPGELRQSVLLFGPLDPWTSGVAPREIIGCFSAAGISEFVFSWPPAEHLGAFEGLAAELL